jgi:hypothetical protein
MKFAGYVVLTMMAMVAAGGPADAAGGGTPSADAAEALLAARIHADSDAAVAEKFGLLGTWQMDCAKPAGPTNAQYVYTEKNGAVFSQLTMKLPSDGPGTLTNLVARPNGMLESLWTRTATGAASTVTLHRVGNRMASWRSVGDGGTVYVKDGLFVRDGKPSAWLTKCGTK